MSPQAFATAYADPAAPLVPLIHLPAIWAERTALERESLVRDLLNTEVSPEGLAILTRDGTFGPLRSIFPAEAQTIADTAKVSPDECVAFALTRATLTAELVLHRDTAGTYRVLRCNDIRQLAPLPTPP